MLLERRSVFLKLKQGPEVAQWLWRLTSKREVVGSNLTLG